MISSDLPADLPGFLVRFGTDEACRDYLFSRRWPEGFCCPRCRGRHCYRLATRIVYGTTDLAADRPANYTRFIHPGAQREWKLSRIRPSADQQRSVKSRRDQVSNGLFCLCSSVGPKLVVDRP